MTHLFSHSLFIAARYYFIYRLQYNIDKMSETKKRRRRGERSDGRIEVTYTDGYNPDGSPHRLHFYEATRAEAERKRDEYKARGAVGLVAKGPADGLTVNAWIDKWISVYCINTAMYGVYIERVRADVGRLPLESVREADLVQSLRAYQGIKLAIRKCIKQRKVTNGVS